MIKLASHQSKSCSASGLFVNLFLIFTKITHFIKPYYPNRIAELMDSTLIYCQINQLVIVTEFQGIKSAVCHCPLLKWTQCESNYVFDKFPLSSCTPLEYTMSRFVACNIWFRSWLAANTEDIKGVLCEERKKQ